MINQEVKGNNNNTQLNVAGGNISSNMYLGKDEKAEIEDLITKIKNTLSGENISDDEKECVLDDLVSVEEQIVSDIPKKARLKSAIVRLGKFAQNLPSTIAKAEIIAASIGGLVEKVKPIIENI